MYICFWTGGLRYHGMAPLISHVYELGFMEAISIPQIECFRGGSSPNLNPSVSFVNFTSYVCIRLVIPTFRGLIFLQVLFSLQELKG